MILVGLPPVSHLESTRLGEFNPGWSLAHLAAAEKRHPDGFFPGAPDVAIEIASRTDQWLHVIAKFEAAAAPDGLVLDIGGDRAGGNLASVPKAISADSKQRARKFRC